MLRRKIIKKLAEWKNNEDRLPLIVKGLRQVGKTTSILEFANNNYEKVYYLNFFENSELMKIFDSSLSSDSILSRMSLFFPNFTIEKENTVIILDEIQDCPKARTALKFLAKNKDFDIIASGSLLGIKYNEVSSYPVGYNEELEMNPMDFEEYLWAKGINNSLIELVKNGIKTRTKIDDVVHNQFISLFKEYIVVGGMPNVVQSFINTQNFDRVLTLQRGIIEDYKSDIIKYASSVEKPKIRNCFDSIPSQLAQDYKKFKYSLVDSHGTTRKYGGSLNWLFDAGIINFCYNITALAPPLSAMRKNNEFKVYIRDTGLLVSMLDRGTARQILEGDIGIYKGAIFENVIASCLYAQDYPLYYYKPSDSLELDFVIYKENKIYPVEVKSGYSTKSKSLITVLNNPKYQINQGIRLSMKNVGDDDKIITIPIYAAFLI